MEVSQERNTEPGERRSGILGLILRVLLPLGMLGLGWAGYSTLSVEPEEAKQPAEKPRVIKTRVMELRVRDYPTLIQTRGTIRPHNEVTLAAQVSGKIIRLRPGFEDGAFFVEGEVLVELDPADLEAAVIVAEAQVARAKTIYAQEQTRANQAKLNWEDLGYDEEPSDLVLRLPQVREAKANLDSANAQVEQAKRNLERTKVRAPFEGRVRRRLVGLGQVLGAGAALGIVYAIDFAEVRLPIAGRDMAFLTLPEGPRDAPIAVELRDGLNPNNETVWSAMIVRTEGVLDESSLELFAIARINDPFGRKSKKPPLRIGQPVLAAIPGRLLKNVIVVPRMAVRQLDQIILVDANELTIESRTIEAIWSDEENVVLRDSTIADGALLSMTRLIYAPNGAKVEILPDPAVESNALVGVESNEQAGGDEEGR